MFKSEPIHSWAVLNLASRELRNNVHPQRAFGIAQQLEREANNFGLVRGPTLTNFGRSELEPASDRLNIFTPQASPSAFATKVMMRMFSSISFLPTLCLTG
jgi:hypothetical protein